MWRKRIDAIGLIMFFSPQSLGFIHCLVFIQINIPLANMGLSVSDSTYYFKFLSMLQFLRKIL